MNLVTVLLRLEGLAILIASTWAYFALVEGSWVLFAALILVPDLSTVGYLLDRAWGARTYNIVHNEALTIAVVVAGSLLGELAVVGVGLILAAHVGMDRAFGYGLEFPGAFNDTHLQRLSSDPLPLDGGG